MRTFILLLSFLLTITTTGFAQTSQVYFADQPTLTPDGNTIIFSYEGDLWRVDAEGGAAARITAMEGEESHPRVSPDGQWIAFSGTQYGNPDVFIVPVNGGDIRQLTYHEATDKPTAWSWDSQLIYFSSSRENSTSAYAVSPSGGTPRRLFGHYFNTVHNLVPHPTGKFFFNESWESDFFVHRKRYKGDFNPDVKSYNPETGEYKEYTDYEGKDFGVTVDRNGQTYFLSDEFNGEYNIYELDGDQKKRLTDFETSVWWPQVNADGGRIVFQRDYQIYLFDTESGASRKVDIEVVRNNTLTKSQDFNVKGKISNFDVSNDGKKLAFVSRGELFVSDAKGKFIRKLHTRPEGRVLEVHWLKDGKMLLFNQTVGGYQNWFTIPADGSGAEKQITDDAQNNRQLTFNSDKSKAVYLSGREELRLLDLETMASTTLHRDELWGFYNDDPQFSPDDRYVLFTAYRNFERDLMLYDLESKDVTNLTETGVSEASPYWSPDGKYIYFTGNLTKPSYPYGPDDVDLHRLPLQAFPEPFRSEKFEALFAEEEKEDEKEEEGSAKEEEEEQEKPEVNIRFEGLMDRLETVGQRFGNQLAPVVLQEDEKTTILYLSNHDGGKTELWKTVLEPFEDSETKKIEGVKNGYDLRWGKDAYFVLSEGAIHSLDLKANKAEKIEHDYTFRRNLRAEFEQMFYETWANMEENFYNETFHGIDWEAMRDRYAQFLPYINNRSDLRRLTNDMLGELNTSHFGFRSSGEEEEVYLGTRTMSTGIVFEKENPYVVSRIIEDSPADRYGIDIQPGDRLLRINGQEVDPARNRNVYFEQPSRDEELSLTFRRGEEDVTAKLHPVSYGAVKSDRYDEWEAACQDRVDRQSDKRIAYVHMKNMGGGELNRFLKEMVAEGQQREALILDLRYNTGGNVHNDVLQFLAQRPYLKWKYREGTFSSQPHFAPAAKPIVLLVNEQSLSDAEMTAAGFKELGLGTIIGTETYRWIIFTSGKGLVDGSFYRLPSWGCYTLDGKNLERTGVTPDIYVRNTFKDRIEENDPQLDKAIEVILGQLKKEGTK